MTPEQRIVIEEAVGRRITYPPGALAWAALRKVLEELLEPPAIVETRERSICRNCGNTIERLPWLPYGWAHRDFDAGPGSGYLGEKCQPLPQTTAAPLWERSNG